MPKPSQAEVLISFQDGAGQKRELSGTIVDANEAGLGLQVRAAIVPGSLVSLSMDPAAAQGLKLQPRARVCWCRSSFGGNFRIGLQYDLSHAEAPPAPPVLTDVEEDLYDILEVSHNASPDTIHRVYRILAQRLHPDNPESGNDEAFKRLTLAYRVLNDPERRAAYDLHREEIQRKHWRIFLSPDAAVTGPAQERRKRRGVLQALYRQRLQEPGTPAVGMLQLEDILGVPRDHLEFTVWYLRERGMITRSDNNRFQITVAGVDHAEQLMAEDTANSSEVNPSRLLPTGAR
jgi:hypothetical protein